MKSLFKSRFLEVSLIKGFVIGGGLSDTSTYFILFLGPLSFEFVVPKKKIKSIYDIEY